MTDRREDFYIGYRPEAPADLGRFMARTAAALVGGGLLIALVVAAAQRPNAPSVFETATRRFEGTVRASPYPMLVVPRPEPVAAASLYLLVSQGKHGAEPWTAGQDGAAVTLDGRLIYRGVHVMIEVSSWTGTGARLASSGVPGLAIPEESPGDLVEVSGEIVDSKCHLGAMNPGDGLTHRECATRCLRGGIPPLLATATGEVLLLTADGGPAGPAVLGHLGVPVRVRGRMARLGSWRTLDLEPASWTGVTP